MKTIIKIRLITALIVASMVATLTYTYLTNPSISDVVTVAQGTANSATYEKVQPKRELTGFTTYKQGGKTIQIEYHYSDGSQTIITY